MSRSQRRRSRLSRVDLRLEAARTIECRTISIEHITIHSDKSFDDAASALKSAVPPIDQSQIEALATGSAAEIEKFIAAAPLFIFLKRDHGALLRVAGQSRKALQYEIGNPLTETKMTRHKIEAALYAPLRVVLYEDELGGCAFVYDLPSSVLGQFAEERVLAVARELDEALRSALLRAAI